RRYRRSQRVAGANPHPGGDARACTSNWRGEPTGAREVRAVCQRVSEARVRIDGAGTGEIGTGIAGLLVVARRGSPSGAVRPAGKVARLRIFADERGKFDRSVLDVGGRALVVSQFTLIADSKRQKGTRPDFSQAAPREQAKPFYEAFCDALRAEGVP